MKFRTHQRRGPWTALALILLIGSGLLVIQRNYIRKHAPLIEAELAAADSAGLGVFEGLGLPEGSTPYELGEKRYRNGGKGTWRGVNTGVTWERTYEMPGDFPKSVAWYRERLLADGWSDFDSGPPSTVMKQFKKGKWLLTLWRSADFPKYTRVRIELSWGYFHNAD